MAFKGLILPAAHRTSAGAAPTPVSLQPIANRPIVCHVLRGLSQAGIAEVVIPVPAAEREELEACLRADGPPGLEVEHVVYGQAGELETALAEAARIIGDSPCVAHAANGLLTQPLAPLLELLHEEAADLIALVHQPSASGGSIGLAARRLLRLVGGPSDDGTCDLAGVCVLGPGALRRAHGARWWQGRELDLVALAERLAESDGRLRIERVRGWRHYTGDVADLLELNRLALDGLATEPADDERRSANGTGPHRASLSGEGNRIEGEVTVHPTACVHSSVIVGPAIVGPGALVLESYIGPYTSIGADVRIEGAEVERSIILPRASITHIGGRLVGSVVGRDARIFRDFSLPRALRMNVGDGGEVALC